MYQSYLVFVLVVLKHNTNHFYSMHKNIKDIHNFIFILVKCCVCISVILLSNVFCKPSDFSAHRKGVVGWPVGCLGL